MKLSDYLQADVFGRSGQCPNCGSPKVLWRGTSRSFRIAGLVAIILFLIDYITGSFQIPRVGGTLQDLLYHMTVFFSLATLVALIAAVTLGFSALFGQNRCTACKHRWR